MSNELWLAVIVATPPLVASLVLLLITLSNNRIQREALEVQREGLVVSKGNAVGIQDLQVKTDGVLTRMEDRVVAAAAETTVARQETADAKVAGAEAASHAAGVKEERERAAGQPST